MAGGGLEAHLYSALTDLTNLDLCLCCYDLTSSCLVGSVASSARFPSKAFGYSRDRRSDRPQIVLGLLTTGDGVPIAHHVFAGNTNDASTLPGVLDDLAERFAISGLTTRAMRELDRIRRVTLTTGQRTIQVVTRRSALQARILALRV